MQIKYKMGADYYIYRSAIITFKDGTKKYQEEEKIRGDIQDWDVKKYSDIPNLIDLVMEEHTKNGSGFAFKDGKWQPNGLKYHINGWGMINTDTIDNIQVSTYCIERF